jgi:N-acyl-D-amino-acid deacylase
MADELRLGRCGLLVVLLFWTVGCSFGARYDVVLRGGTVYDGSGEAPRVADVALRGDRVVAVESGVVGRGRREFDARGLAVAPGFINVLSWADTPLLEDGRSQSDIRQGVTLEVFGEGWSMGPLNDAMKKDLKERQGDIRYDVAWTSLGEYLEHLTARGVSPNVASFVGATTVRIYVLGYEDRAPSETELARMKRLVDAAMQDGALGVASSLIYAPAFYASTEELVELARVAGRHGGVYISHLRGEGTRLLEALEELVRIARDADVAAEIYHLKASGQANWDKLNQVIVRVEEAQREGLQITANMYTYAASSTGLNSTMPPWVQEGGHDEWVRMLQDPAIRTRVLKEMRGGGDYDNSFANSGGPEGVLLVSFKNDALKPLTGKTLAEVARERGRPAAEVAMDLVVEDDSRVGCVFFTMSEDNVRKKVRLPWVTFGSDGGSFTNEGVFLRSNPHPRGYGNFARLLGRYVREEELISLTEAVHRLSALPAGRFGLRRRGRLEPGYFADVVVFDPRTISDHATFEKPHQYSTGVEHVFVNGVQVLRDGEHTGAKPGRVVRGPGWRGRQQ